MCQISIAVDNGNAEWCSMNPSLVLGFRFQATATELVFSRPGDPLGILYRRSALFISLFNMPDTSLLLVGVSVLASFRHDHNLL